MLTEEVVQVTPGSWSLSYDAERNALWLVLNNRYLLILDHDNVEEFLTYLEAPSGVVNGYLLAEPEYVEYTEYEDDSYDYVSYQTNDPCYVKDLAVVSTGTCKIAFSPADEGELKQLTNDLYSWDLLEYLVY